MSCKKCTIRDSSACAQINPSLLLVLLPPPLPVELLKFISLAKRKDNNSAVSRCISAIQPVPSTIERHSDAHCGIIDSTCCNGTTTVFASSSTFNNLHAVPYARATIPEAPSVSK